MRTLATKLVDGLSSTSFSRMRRSMSLSAIAVTVTVGPKTIARVGRAT
jgi:hypothetical protein